jgi:cyclophilin family peptidyl-prolyl cis-trans isomerase
VEESPPKVKDLEDEILTDFVAPIGAVAMMDSSADSTTSKFFLIHGFDRYIGNPGPSSPDRRAHFCYEGVCPGRTS